MRRATKSVSVSIRESRLFNRCVAEAAAREQRSLRPTCSRGWCSTHPALAVLTEEPAKHDAPREGEHGHSVTKG